MFIGFWKPKDNYGVFSNWSHAEFEMDGHHFTNSEQAFMYLKAKLFGDSVTAEKILNTKSPMIAKNLGRAVKPFDSVVFNKEKFNMMVKVCYAKFSQNENLKQILLSTKDATLVEASPKDRIWGIGMTVDDPNFNDPSKWHGTNLLGKALMEVRKTVNNER